MPFVKVDLDKLIKEECDNNLKFTEMYEEADKEYKDIQDGKLDKKFGE